MAFSALLKVKGGLEDGYNVLECDYEFSQMEDSMTYKPATDVKGGKINFSILSLDKSIEKFFYGWMFSKDEVKDGEFIFPIWTKGKGTSDVTLSEKILKFENAFCIKLSEKFSNLYLDKDETPTGMIMNISLSATKIIFTGEEFTNNEIDS